MNKEVNSRCHEIAMTIIANSGEAKGLAFSALRTARDEGDLVKAKQQLKEANEFIHTAHLAQTALLTMTASEEEVQIDVLLVHSQDHLMTTMVVTELIAEMIEMFKPKNIEMRGSEMV